MGGALGAGRGSAQAGAPAAGLSSGARAMETWSSPQPQGGPARSHPQEIPWREPRACCSRMFFQNNPMHLGGIVLLPYKPQGGLPPRFPLSRCGPRWGRHELRWAGGWAPSCLHPAQCPPWWPPLPAPFWLHRGSLEGWAQCPCPRTALCGDEMRGRGGSPVPSGSPGSGRGGGSV